MIEMTYHVPQIAASSASSAKTPLGGCCTEDDPPNQPRSESSRHHVSANQLNSVQDEHQASLETLSYLMSLGYFEITKEVLRSG
jgi:hypothetical protein